MTDILHLPLNSIRTDALLRDRTALDPAAIQELQTSISRSGLRQPIEVFELATAEGPMRYGLISGLRRLTALRALERAAPDRFGTIAAFLRHPESIAAAMAQMVEENDIRAELSPWERGQIAVTAWRRAVFPTLDAAIDGLFPSATRPRRARLRSLARVVEELDGILATPEALSLRQMLRLAAALRQDFADLIRHVAEPALANGLAAQWTLLLPVLDEAEASLKDPTPYAQGRPRRIIHIPKGLAVRREMTPNGWVLHFTGPEATGMMIDTVLDQIEQMYG